MELSWLEDFLCLARTNNFSRAAQERNITQSAFSRRIKALEHWLGAPLVDRSTYPTTLTAAGHAFLGVAGEVLRALQVARADLRVSGGGRVRFTALHSLALSFFPAWFGAIKTAAGAVDAILQADNMHNCVQALIEGDVDFALIFVHPEMPIVIDPVRFAALPVGADRLVPLCAPKAKGSSPRFALSARAGKALPHLAYGPDAFLGRAVEIKLRERPGCRLHAVYENAMAEALKAMALAGHGLTWLPETSAAEELKTGRLVRAGGPAWDIPLGVRLYRTPERGNPQVEAIWAAAKALAPNYS
jgi:DNA-binding transcriptional LysR family regulator